MAYKEKQLDSNAAKALSQAWGSTNANMAKGSKKKQPAAKKNTGNKGGAKKK